MQPLEYSGLVSWRRPWWCLGLDGVISSVKSAVGWVACISTVKACCTLNVLFQCYHSHKYGSH